jgi:hypothetical protein
LKRIDSDLPSDIVALIPKLTEEQWAENDRRIAEERARHDDFLPAYQKLQALQGQRLTQEGWPSRPEQAARNPDMTTPAIIALSSWNSEAKSVAVLSGPPGTGKTVAAAWWRAKNYGMNFLRASTFAATSRYDEKARAFAYDASALCLDDLGSEYLDAKGSFLVDLDELIDTYYADERPLIITTNLNAADFKARYGRRVEDRIRECGEWFTVAGKSMRGVR